MLFIESWIRENNISSSFTNFNIFLLIGWWCWKCPISSIESLRPLIQRVLKSICWVLVATQQTQQTAVKCLFCGTVWINKICASLVMKWHTFICKIRFDQSKYVYIKLVAGTFIMACVFAVYACILAWH